jgi:23S rRNA (adenine2030-N6)-methyltransferase
MLSYQHMYHAGNLADVHKHALLALTLDYMVRKDKPLSYIESHAGRGLYRLDSAEALKTGEAGQGIRRLAARFPAAHPYSRRLTEVRARFGDAAYPGSPLIAALTLRKDDALHLAELHPQENAALRAVMLPWGAHIRAEDGLTMALALVPPTPRRGVLLIDPSYEVKDEYETIPKRILAIHRKWNVGTILLWYPILGSGAHRTMVASLTAALPEAILHEVLFPPAKDGHRMIGSGLFAVNAPYLFADWASDIADLFATLA